MAQKKDSSFSSKAKLAIPLLAVAITTLIFPALWFTLMALFGIACFVEAIVYGLVKARTLKQTVMCMLMMVIIVRAFIHMAWLRTEPDGVWLIVLIAVPVMVCDVFAQLVGRSIPKENRRPFFPNTSPNKSLQGAIGGYLGGVTSGLIIWGVWLLFADSVPTIPVLPIIFVAPVLGIVGDLIESKTKRMLGLDDFSNWLGSHGGFNDRFDALTFAFAVNGTAMWLW